MVIVQTGNMLDVVVEGKSIGLKQRDSDHRKYEVIWLPDPEMLAVVLMRELDRIENRSAENKTSESGSTVYIIRNNYATRAREVSRDEYLEVMRSAGINASEPKGFRRRGILGEVRPKGSN